MDGQEVHLTGKERSILELLVLRKGMVLTKEAFLNHLYGGMDEPEMKIIDVFICKLRKKLAVAGADNLIGTVWGRGYMIREPAEDGVGVERRWNFRPGWRSGQSRRNRGPRVEAGVPVVLTLVRRAWCDDRSPRQGQPDIRHSRRAA